MKIGVLALQGAFIEHEVMLKKLNVECFEIRQKKDLQIPMDGLILPGGESTVIGKLLNDLELFNDIKTLIDNNLPVFGTCAGLILLAKEIKNESYTYFGSINMKVKRNAYGRQLGSFETNAEFKGIGQIPMVFIRAPYIEAIFEPAEILAIVDNKIVAAKERKILVTAFHPELTNDLSVHKYWLNMIQK